MTLLKAAASALGKPLLMGLIIEGAGLLLVRGPRRRAGIWMVAAGALISYLASIPLVGNALLSGLEHRYPAFDPTQAGGVRDIVVLGSGYDPQDHVPVTGALDPDGLARIVEGVRLARSRPDTRLLVSGGALPGFTPGALGYAQMAVELGIDRSALVILDEALDTAQEAREVVGALGHAPFILVTSAYHMPRAMRIMQRAGANPLPAPTGQILHPHRGTERLGLIPGSRGLHETELALHEYLGLAALDLGLE